MNARRASTRDTGSLDRTQPTLGPGHLARERDDAVLPVDVDDGGLPGARLLLVLDLGEGGDDDDVAGAGQVGGRAVDANDARPLRPLERVGLEPRAVATVPDVNL